VVTKSGPRVLVIAPPLRVGGTELHLLRVLPRLRQAGLDILVFTMVPGGHVERLLVAAGVPVLGIQVGGGRVLRALQVAWALCRQIRKLRPDILHSFLSEPYLVGSLAAFGMTSLKRVMSRRSLSNYQSKYPLVRFVERILHRSAVALIGNSCAVAAQLREESGQRDKVGIIHNGIMLPELPDVYTRLRYREQLGIQGEAFVIVVVANLIPYKGHSDLFEAIATVQHRLGEGWRLILVGRDEGIGAALRILASKLGIERNILWLGELPEPQNVLAAADLGILSSHEEGFSNSLIEKMAFGLPVIATRVGGNMDAIVDEESGVLVPAHDPASLGARVAGLYEDAELRKRIGAAARVRVERMFTLEACTQRYLNLYRGLIGDRRIPVCEMVDSLPTLQEPVCALACETSIPSR
jgi:glycosyltransferase involved in cell wall biosynthesis